MGFKEDIISDFDDVLNLDDQITALYSHGGGAAVSVPVLFWNDYKEDDIYTGAVATTSPLCFGKQSDFSAVAVNDSLIIGGLTYYVAVMDPDEFGGVRLHLSRDRV
jgi:hypothetical protein